MSRFTHLDEAGRARMVDVGDKAATSRLAVAEGRLRLSAGTLAALREGRVPKGDVLAVARVAGIMGAKRTAELVPLCHPLALDAVAVDLEAQDEPPAVYCRATVTCRGRTGVEMEALTAVQVALLAVYDMCKALDRGMVMEGIRLLEKSGGRSGHWRAGGR